MAISPIGPMKPVVSITSLDRPKGASGTAENGAVSFQDTMKNAVKEVNHLQNQADTTAQKLATGDVEVHQAMIAMQKAKLALELTISVRNKVVEAYQEVMRMQV